MWSQDGSGPVQGSGSPVSPPTHPGGDGDGGSPAELCGSPCLAAWDAGFTLSLGGCLPGVNVEWALSEGKINDVPGFQEKCLHCVYRVLFDVTAVQSFPSLLHMLNPVISVLLPCWT